jgi:hypothetical protein
MAITEMRSSTAKLTAPSSGINPYYLDGWAPVADERTTFNLPVGAGRTGAAPVDVRSQTRARPGRSPPVPPPLVGTGTVCQRGPAPARRTDRRRAARRAVGELAGDGRRPAVGERRLPASPQPGLVRASNAVWGWLR